MAFCIGAVAEDKQLNTQLFETQKVYMVAQNETAPAEVVEAAAAEVTAEEEKPVEEAPKAEEPKDLGDAISLGTQVAKLIKDKNYQMAIALLLVLLVWGYKKLAGMGLLKKWLPVGGKKTTMIAMAMGVLLELAAHLVIPESVWWIAVLQGVVIGGASTGLWDLMAGQKMDDAKA